MARPQVLSILLVLAASCGSEDNLTSEQSIECSSERPCRTGYSCLERGCIPDGRQEEGDPCVLEQQCGVRLRCLGGKCTPACSPTYELADCEEGRWCKPRIAGDDRIGSCVASECDPSVSRTCSNGETCVAYGLRVGDCMRACEYGFLGEQLIDTCDAANPPSIGCHPYGLNMAPVCLELGGEEAPAIGEPGCHPRRAPCATRSICVGAVCRRLCRPNQASPCERGESCVQLGQWPDFHYCRAN